ncbi:alpha/beta hydrolase [Microbacterium sp. 4R-513]|uniref:alpha/beta hydrolase n=1 Tax=Microbacterium sp. 4R-513 TaxID=2567934 RepID=UPI0013E1C191|nr:alpha/beta hydrolase [Microbacterium sp. 4R-513]QIG38539.1 alpha/beta hydrolase [Microbacterium sp. 4R-513]
MRRRLIAASVLSLATLVLSACGAEQPAPSATGNPDVRVERSIDYRTIEGDTLQLDACLPAEGGTDLPSVVLVHGGAFQEGDRSNMSGVCESIAAQGWAAFAVDYRLIPDSYPAQVDDVGAAVEWLRDPAQAERFGISPDGLALLGSSAGGIIALSTAARLGAAGEGVDSVVTLSAAGDLTSDALRLGTPDPALEKVVLGYLGCKTVEDCPDAVAASPRYNVGTLPPTLLVHGSKELIPVAQAKALHQAMTDAGIPADLQIEDGDHHGLQLLTPAVAASVFRFLEDNSSP